MTLPRVGLIVALLVAGTASAAAQRVWTEVRSENFTVVSDAGAGRARDIAWQFEQIRAALGHTFPWIRTTPARPIVVFVARGEQTMRTLLPAMWEQGRDGARFSSIGQTGRDRAYIVVRGDYRIDDREGISPYQAAYWSYAARALGDTSPHLPEWLVRGMSELLSNTLVRDTEIQIGRTLPQNLRHLRSRPRLSLQQVIAPRSGTDRPSVDDLFALDAHAWAFVHFLVWADRGAYAPLLNAYITGVLAGADPVTSVATTLGDVSRFENAFNVYINRDVFFFASFPVAARLGQDGFPARDLSAADAATMRALLLVAGDRPADARVLAVEAEKLGPAGVSAEVAALLAETDDVEGERVDQLKAALERAVTQPQVSWYAPYRLATLLRPAGDRALLARIAALLEQATTANPNADAAWAYLGEVRAAVGRADAVTAAERAIVLMPASSRHRVSLARVYLRLGRQADALRAAGIGRALARDQAERANAQGVLAELARAMTSTESPDAAGVTATATPPSASRAAEIEPATAASLAVDAPAPGTVETRAIGQLIQVCYTEAPSCARALPVIVADCNGGSTVTSTAACREAGYILDVGIGMAANPQRAAALYLIGCDRRDTLSCVRLSTLRALGRGVPRDEAAALAVLEPACDGGTQEACYRLGLHLTASGVAVDRERGREVLTSSCANGFAESCAALKTRPPGGRRR